MRLKVKKFVYDEQAGYEIHLESGEIMKVGKLVSKGTRRRPEEGDHYSHTLRFSDGVVEKAILSTEVVTIPDCSQL